VPPSVSHAGFIQILGEGLTPIMFTVSLRIYGKNLDTSDVTSDLNLEPTIVFNVGDKMTNNSVSGTALARAD
jgi:hypothetical protein